MPLKIEQSPREVGRYFVTGETLHCPQCGFEYKCEGQRPPKYAAADPCPKDGTPLRHYEYLVDMTEYGGLGRCGCRRWETEIQPLLNSLHESELELAIESDRLRCQHIEAVLRHLGLDRVKEMNG